MCRCFIFLHFIILLRYSHFIIIFSLVDLAQWQSQVKKIRSGTELSTQGDDERLDGNNLSRKFDEAVNTQEDENRNVNSDQTPIPRRHNPMPMNIYIPNRE